MLPTGKRLLHPQHTAEALHAKLPKSKLVITSEYYADTLKQMIRESEEQGDSPLVDRVDEEIDKLVYELYKLTEEEVKIVEGT